MLQDEASNKLGSGGWPTSQAAHVQIYTMTKLFSVEETGDDELL